MVSYMSHTVLFPLSDWATYVTNHISKNIHFELHVYVCNLEFTFGKY